MAHIAYYCRRMRTDNPYSRDVLQGWTPKQFGLVASRGSIFTTRRREKQRMFATIERCPIPSPTTRFTPFIKIERGAFGLVRFLAGWIISPTNTISLNCSFFCRVD